jgi:hypothetical protein
MSGPPKEERTNYHTTIMRRSGEDMPIRAWHRRMVSLIQAMEFMCEFDIRDNGYRRFPSVFVNGGVTGSFKGHRFSVWSDLPGEIILRHPGVPRSQVEPLCRTVEGCWLSLSEDQRLDE